MNIKLSIQHPDVLRLFKAVHGLQRHMFGREYLTMGDMGGEDLLGQPKNDLVWVINSNQTFPPERGQAFKVNGLVSICERRPVITFGEPHTSVPEYGYTAKKYCTFRVEFDAKKRKWVFPTGSNRDLFTPTQLAKSLARQLKES